MSYSAQTLDFIAGNITAGCNGTDTGVPANFNAGLKLYYPVVRNMMCLKKYASTQYYSM
jgi:hypothetical protein